MNIFLQNSGSIKKSIKEILNSTFINKQLKFKIPYFLFCFVYVPVHGCTFENTVVQICLKHIQSKSMGSESTGQGPEQNLGAWIVLSTDVGKHTKFKEGSRQNPRIFPTHILVVKQIFGFL